MKPVCLVLGAGAGIGGQVGKRFALGGYHSVLCRRSDKEGLDRLVTEIHDAGGEATGFQFNAVDPGSIEKCVAETEANIGPIKVVVFNLGAQVGDHDLLDTSYKVFERCWQMATFALFRVASAALPLMVERGEGALLVTSATAAVRGNAGQHAHAAAMGGRRMLCQTLNAEFSKKGVHVAHLLMDSAVDAPDTLGKILGPERFKEFRETHGMEHDGIIVPSEVANTYYHIAHQHRSSWTHEMDFRSFSDTPWWNHG